MASTRTNYVSGLTYAAQGAPLSYLYGNTLNRRYTYNARRQPTMVQDALASGAILWRLWPGWNSTDANGVPRADNNGNLLSLLEENGGPGYPQFLSFTQSFTYDGVNRLQTASESNNGSTTWSRRFSYDPYGNAWVSGNSGVALAGTTPTANVYTGANRMNAVPYDNAGNQLMANGNTLGYDAENRQTSVTSPGSTGGGTESYAYDGNGQRVGKSGPGGTTVYVYDAFGQLAAEYSTAVASTPLCTTCYLSADHLGSVRLVTNQAGNVVSRHDYLPFGEEMAGNAPGRNSQFGASDNVSQRFTGQERDSESGLDYFGARYFGSALGRWTSPDVLNVTNDRLLNPSRTLNKYVYGANNPLSLVDPDGRDVVALVEPPHGVLPGHFMLFANNPQSGESGMMSFGPVDSSNSGRFFTALNGPMSSTNTYDLSKTADELRSNYAALSIQTTPEQAQEVLNLIKSTSASTPEDLYRVLSKNCTTVCRDALKAVGALPSDSGNITPFGLWSTLFQKYAKNPTYSSFSSLPYASPSFSIMNIQNQKGVDYGSPRFGMNTFDFIMLQLKSHCTESWDPKTNTLHGCIQ